jgi:hypothetical protein
MQGNFDRVKEILQSTTVKVNQGNASGELPLVLAAKKFKMHKNYPGRILLILHDYGACYLLKNRKGEAACEVLNRWNYSIKELPEDLYELQVKSHSLRHLLIGCGIPNKGCTNNCNDDGKEYSPDFKAGIALESFCSSSSLEEIAKKKGVLRTDVIRWRWQARENLEKLFKKNQS